MNGLGFSLLTAVACLGAMAEAGHFDKFYNHYHDSAVYKVLLKSKTSPKAEATLDRTLELVRFVHDVSGGMHQIVYLVGWQYDGHDSKYPDWGEVGAQCASSLSPDPRESLRSAIRRAREWNTDLSLHINMNDAYTNAPSWRKYCDRKVLCYNKAGQLHPGGVWGGEQSYRVSHVKEWREGLAQERILGLLELLPELKESHTIHIDALFGQESVQDGISEAEDERGIRQAVDFWHEQGMDVTCEFLTGLGMVGYFPMVHHFNLDERHRLQISPTVLCGGDSAWNARENIDYYSRWKGWWASIPDPGASYSEAWGEGQGDVGIKVLQDKPAFVSALFRRSFLHAYYNQSRPIRHSVDRERYIVEWENGTKSVVTQADRKLKVTAKSRTVVEEGDYFLDFPYNGGVILAYSEKGCEREFVLPEGWPREATFAATAYPEGNALKIRAQEGLVKLRLPSRTSLVIPRAVKAE